MLNKKVRVFWPVDSQWYIAKVQEYDAKTKEHLLQYPDGDVEWVRIGEDHTTNTSYKEYCNSLNNVGDTNNALQGGVSFAFSGLCTAPSMSRGFGPEGSEPLKKDPLQQLNLDRTSSSMSSFGLNAAAIGRQQSFQRDDGSNFQYGQTTTLPPFQLLSPNYTHSFSSRKGSDEAGKMEGRVPGQPPSIGPTPYLYGARSESWDRPPPPSNHPYRPYPPYDPRNYTDRNNGQQPHHYENPNMHPYPRAGGDSKEERPRGDNPQYYPMHSSFGCDAQSWRGQSQHGYYEGQQPPMYSYPGTHQPPSDKSEPQLISPADADGHPDLQQKGAETVSQKPPKLPPINGPDKQRKAPTVTWTKEEDEHLLDMVFEMKHPLKWSVIAQNLGTNRTGKQCRERYVNHLNPRLKSTEWTPTEGLFFVIHEFIIIYWFSLTSKYYPLLTDFVIWRLYATIGTQWAKMSKVIPGRTDNGIKNRFHNLKRQLDREEESRIRSPRPDKYEIKVREQWIRDIPPTMRSKIEELWNVERGIGKIAADTVKATRDREEEKNARYGPFEKVTSSVQCLRCALFVPSVQCGDEVCAKTQWCRSCTDVPVHMSGNTLRECLNLKKIQNQALNGGLEDLMGSFRVR